MMKTGALSVAGNITQTGTGYHLLAKGTTEQRPSAPQAGMVRYNTTIGSLEVFDGTSWDTLVSGGVTKTIIGADGAVSGDLVFCYDTSRAKWLSAETETYSFYNRSVATDDWIMYDSELSSDVGYIMPYPGTIISLTGYTSDANGLTRSISVYVNNTEHTNQLSIGSTQDIAVTASKTNNNIDFQAGDRLRLRARASGGFTFRSLSDVLISVRVKWRG